MIEMQNIQELVDRFWKGETSKEEEWMLREAIRFGKPSPELKELAAYFQFVEQECEDLVLGDEFDSEILNKIRPARKLLFPQWRNMAAAIVILMGLGIGAKQFMMREKKPEFVEMDTFEDPEKALQEVQKALMLLSGNMNKGFEHTSLIGKFHTAKQEIETNLKDDKRNENN